MLTVASMHPKGDPTWPHMNCGTSWKHARTMHMTVPFWNECLQSPMIAPSQVQMKVMFNLHTSAYCGIDKYSWHEYSTKPRRVLEFLCKVLSLYICMKTVTRNDQYCEKLNCLMGTALTLLLGPVNQSLLYLTLQMNPYLFLIKAISLPLNYQKS